MKARVKATGEVITVKDYGVKFHPRYWSDGAGWRPSELEFIKGKNPAKVTTPGVPEFLAKIDWPLLRRQKETLVRLTSWLRNRIWVKLSCRLDEKDLEGILHLLDAIQDYAVDKAGIPSKTVFGRLK